MSNFKSTRRALVTSLISMLLCFVMLLGTTFAWFTDSVTSSGNVIKSGTLDVEMYWAAGTENPDAANWKDASKGAIFDYDRWEPGYTVARHLKIENKGTLALNYKLAIIPHGEVSKLADVIDVYYIPEALRVDRDTDLSAYKQGTLRDLINTGIAAGSLKEMGNAADTYVATIVLKMRDEAGNEYQGLSIGSDFSIQLLATQQSYEEDSFDETYDENAFFVVDKLYSTDPNDNSALVNAINNAIDTTTIFVQPGTYVVSSGIQLYDKSITIAGLGVVNFETAVTNDHMWRIQDGNDPESDMVVTIKNINFDGKDLGEKNLFMVKYNVTLNLENVITKNSGGVDICMDNGNPLNDGKFYNGVTTTVNLKNSDVEKVSMDTVPVVKSHSYYPTPAGVETYAKLWFDADSSVAIVEKQAWVSADPTTMYINGDNSDPMGVVFYANDDATLKAALAAIHTSAYWNQKLTLKLAAGEYAGDYVVNQYPAWNGENGHGNLNNPYNSGVPADAPSLDLTIVGTAMTTFARGMAVTPATVFTGSFTVNGFGNSMTGFATTAVNQAPITFKTVAFKGDYDGSADFVGDSIVFYALNAVDNLYFDGCHFVDATHITIGQKTPHNAGSIYFTNCNFDEGGCISGRFTDITVTNCVVNGATKGFINEQKADAGMKVTIDGLTANVGAYLVRTNGNVNINIANSDITVTKSEGTDSVIVSRGAGDVVKFVDCELNAASIIGGSHANKTDASIQYDDKNGNTYIEDPINDTLTLGAVNDNATGTFTVPEGVDALGNGSFAGSGVTTVVIPDSVKDFGASGVSATGASGGAFKDSAVEKVVLPEGMTEIPAAAFNGAKQLKEVNIPASVKTIGVNAFRQTAIETLVIPATVETISYGAFRTMGSLTTVTIEGDRHIPDYAFRECPALRTVYINGENVTIGTNMAFCNASSNNPGTNDITFYVKNVDVAAQVKASMGTGTNFYIHVENEGDAYWMASDANTLKVALENAIADGGDVVLLGNIDLKDVDWTPVGTSDAPFAGTIDGNGFTISNLTVSGTDYAALIAYTSENATVKNVTLENVNINGNKYAAGVVCMAGKNLTVDNVKVSGTIVGTNYAAGLVLDATAITATNCVNDATVSSQRAAGIVAWADPTAYIDNCVNNGDITGTLSAAGIANRFAGTMKNSTNNGDITATGTEPAGGIVAIQTAATTYEYCVNNGDVKSTADNANSSAAGILGHTPGSAATLNYCDNYGDITAEQSYASGIAYSLYGTITANYCYNAGNVTGADGAGAIAAKAQYGTGDKANYCLNEGTITSANGTAYQAAYNSNNCSYVDAEGNLKNVNEDDTDTVMFVSNDDELADALTKLQADTVNKIVLKAGTYSEDINLTVAALGAAKGDVYFVAADGAEVKFTGLTTLGLYVKQGPTAKYAANITFEGITFHQAAADKDSISIQNVGRDNTTNALTLKDCIIINNGEYGVRGVSGGIAYNTRVIGCDFINSAFQPHGNGGTGLVVDDCDFVNAYINVQAGNGVTVQNSRFENTVTDANNSESFYAIRSNATPVTVTKCTFAVDSTVNGVGVAGAKGWAVFVNRGTTNWTVTDCKVTMTDAALAQPALKVAFCMPNAQTGAVGKINMTNVTLNGKSFVSNSDELVEAIKNAADGDEINLLAGTYEVRFTNDTTFNVDNLTITGLGKVYLNIKKDSETHYSRIQGNNVIFNNIDFTGSETNTVGTTGKATYNNCVFNVLELAVSGETYVHKCVVNNYVHTSTDTSTGNAYITKSKLAGAAYNASKTPATITFTDCEIGDISIWDAGTTVLNNCTYGVIEKDSADHLVVIDGVCQVESADAIAAAAAAGYTNFLLADGEYNLYGLNGKTVTISGTENVVIKVANEGEDGLDYGCDGATVTFNGVTFDTTANGGTYRGFVRMNGTYNGCDFVGTYTTSSGTHAFYNCNFDLRNNYVWTWGASSVLFDTCTFEDVNGVGKAILVHQGAAVTEITVRNCTFTASKSAYTWDGLYVAAVSIDPVINETAKYVTVNFEGTNTVVCPDGAVADEYGNTGFAGLYQIKYAADSEYITIKVNGEVVATPPVAVKTK